jgi:hypothetical protein
MLVFNFENTECRMARRHVIIPVYFLDSWYFNSSFHNLENKMTTYPIVLPFRAVYSVHLNFIESIKIIT